MTVYVKEQCGRCKATITNWDLDYRGINVPFLLCDRCGAANDRSKKASEWELMDDTRKAQYYCYVAYWGLFYSVLPIIAIGVIMMRLNPSLERQSIATPTVLLAVVPGLVLGYAFAFYRLRKDIRASTTRMADPTYRRTLADLGYLEQQGPGAHEAVSRAVEQPPARNIGQLRDIVNRHLDINVRKLMVVLQTRLQSSQVLEDEITLYMGASLAFAFSRYIHTPGSERTLEQVAWCVENRITLDHLENASKIELCKRRFGEYNFHLETIFETTAETQRTAFKNTLKAVFHRATMSDAEESMAEELYPVLAALLQDDINFSVRKLGASADLLP